jgi:hypothetical protein
MRKEKQHLDLPTISQSTISKIEAQYRKLYDINYYPENTAKLHPYKMQMVQELAEDDPDAESNFASK